MCQNFYDTYSCKLYYPLASNGLSLSYLELSESGLFSDQRVYCCTMICVALNVDVKTATHNVVCDRLLRLRVSGKSVASIVSECGFREVKVMDLGLCDNTSHFLTSCNPAIYFAAEPDSANYWS